jgi:CRISPR-associated protein Csb2
MPAAVEALSWLEGQPPPTIIAPLVWEGNAFCLSVPNNAMDIVANAWRRGNETNSGDANPATHRTMKQMRSVWMPDGVTLHYVWTLGESVGAKDRDYLNAISDIARCIVAVGWGIDMAVGEARQISNSDLAALPGERWIPHASSTNGHGLRVPRAGSLNDMVRRHRAFLSRLQTDPKGSTRLVPPAPLSAFSTIEYRIAHDSKRRPFAAFSLTRTDGKGFCAFDSARRALSIAGMARHATQLRAQGAGWETHRIAGLVLGHGEAEGERHIAVEAGRFIYLPLPSIESRSNSNRREGPIRRLLISVQTEGYESEIEWVRRSLAGQELLDSQRKRPVALLSPVSGRDNMVLCYTRPATTWATVTPVILPGFDDPAHYRRRLKRGVTTQEQRDLLDRLERRIEGLIRKAIVQAGFSAELAQAAVVEWSKGSFWAGGQGADSYGVPDHLKRFPRFHVRILWQTGRNEPVEVSGPICIGGGRFCGLGLFAAV